MSDSSDQIRALRYELHTLNKVVSNRKQATRDLRTRLESISRRHGHAQERTDRCAECLVPWPCPTYLLANPSVADAVVSQGLKSMLRKTDRS